MVTLHSGKQIIIDNKRIASKEEAAAISQEEAFKNTLTYQVLKKHKHSDNMEHLQIQFDSMGVYPSDCLCQRFKGISNALCIYQLP